MSCKIEFTQDRASAVGILEHLRRCEAGFVPPLGSRVDLEAYSQKIATRAVRFEAWIDRQLVGLVAVYRNDPSRQEAFITTVSVCPEWTGMGIAGRLLSECAASAKSAGFQRLCLETGIRNEAAIRLYKKSGFTTESETGELVRMSLQLDRSPV